MLRAGRLDDREVEVDESALSGLKDMFGAMGRRDDRVDRGAIAELAQIAADVNRRTHDIGARRLHTVLERLGAARLARGRRRSDAIHPLARHDLAGTRQKTDVVGPRTARLRGGTSRARRAHP